jgi:hypothetical protein
MTRILSKSAFIAALSLIILAGYAVLFGSSSGAAELHQAPHLAASNTTNFSAPVGSLTRGQATDAGEVRIVVTTNQGGNLLSRVVATVPNPGVMTSEDTSSSAAAPNQTAAAGDIVFSQIYASGGLVGSTFQNNFLQVFNRTNNTIDINSWRFHISDANGTSGLTISFASSRGIGIPAHRYLLIQFGDPSPNGSPVPNPDFIVPGTFPPPPPGFPPIPPFNLPTSGKVFLTGPAANLSATSCPLPNPEVIDLVGYGSTNTCFEGTGPTATINNTTAAVRKNGGLIDTDNNANDFAVRPPTPLNHTSRPIDDAEFFVRQHYSDFLNRPPDASGLSFWVDQIPACVDAQPCLDVRRINVSAAFFLSIEFQETGYLVERLYKTSYGDATGTSTVGGAHQISVPIVRFNEFLPDTQQIGQGVIIGDPNAPMILENNKVAFIDQFVQRTRFTTAFPVSMTSEQFVDTLNTNAGGALSQAQRDQLVSDLSTSAKTRAQVLRAVAEDADLVNAEKNRAFVLMQYLGYLRRNANDAPDSDYSGYDFWLTKLLQFNGNFVNAEMVKAFISSSEYRQRF